MFEYRSINVSGTWTVQRYLNDGSLEIGPQLVSTHSQTLTNGQGGATIGAKALADAAGRGYAANLGGTFSTSTEAFEV